MSKTQSERIAALEALVAAQAESITALAVRLVEAHARIDHAGVVFKDMRSALRPKTEPASARLPRAEFDRALEDLRAQAEEAGHTTRYFPAPAIVERAANLRRIEADTRAAA